MGVTSARRDAACLITSSRRSFAEDIVALDVSALSGLARWKPRLGSSSTATAAGLLRGKIRVPGHNMGVSRITIST